MDEATEFAPYIHTPQCHHTSDTLQNQTVEMSAYPQSEQYQHVAEMKACLIQFQLIKHT